MGRTRRWVICGGRWGSEGGKGNGKGKGKGVIKKKPR